MAEAAPLPDELQKDKGLFGKQRWRDKLFAREDSLLRKDHQSKGSNDEEVAQFLRAAAPKPTVTTQYSALTPCIDTASAPRWPSATKVEVPMTAEDRYHRPKPRQNKGLRVKFMSTPVVIIGEGGDEAELPSRDVSRSNTISSEDSSIRPMSLQRRPTELEDPATDSKGLQDDREVSHVGQKISTTFLGHEKLPNPPQVSVQDDMPQVQEYDVGSPYDQTSRKSLDSAYSDDHEPRKDRLDTSARNETPSMFPEHIKSSTHSSTPRVSPEPPLGPRATSPRPASLQNPDAQQSSNADNSLPSVQPESVSLSGNEEAHRAGPLSLRNVAKNLGIDAFDDFHTRARRFHEIFRLGIAVHQDLMSVPFTRWVQIAIWWFLKGRGELESAVRARPHSAYREDSGQPQSIPSDLKQAYVDLAKAWWIVKEVTPDHPDLKRFGSASMISMAAIIRRFGDPTLASFVDAHVSLIANMRALAMSMKRNGRLPPDSFEIQKLYTRVLHSPLDLPSSVASLVSGRSQRDLDTPSHSLIPIGDSEHHFSFGRAFVDVFLISRQKQWDMIRVPSIVSILRKKTDLDTIALITGQSGEIDLTISPKSTQTSGLTWKAVHWRPSSLALYMNLSEDVEFSIKFSEEGFKTLWDIYDYNREIQRDSEGREGEEPVFECITRHLQLSGKHPHPKSFPQGPVEDCKIRIFAKTLAVSNGSGERRVDVGYRVMVNTSLKLKIVSTYSQDCGAEKPMVFSRHSRDEGPRLGLILPTPWLSKLDIVFCNMYELDRFRSTLSDTITFENDYCSPYLPLQRLEICTSTGTEFEPNDSKLSGYASNLDLHWQGVRIIERRPSVHGSNQSSTVRSGNRRLILQGQLGHITDYINFTSGELQMSLSADDLNEIRFLRRRQKDVLLTLNDAHYQDKLVETSKTVLSSMAASDTVRAYGFRSLSDVHSFQKMVTQFTVQYDGLASSFLISRRRSMVPISKRWEVTSARIQLLHRDKTVQLAGFFKDPIHAGSMNFVLKFTDFFETFSRSGSFYLRIIDAKFALPREGETSNKEFVCLDIPEWPGEHDDITVGFDDEMERDKFASHLPGTVKKASTMGSLRR